ncbi:glutathione-regulated potassium-efflux system oxidoreductase KefF [Chitinophaga lutea]
MAKILILFAHPVFERSRIHARLVKAAAAVPDVTVRDLYELYPDFDVQPKAEQQFLLAHDVVILQHPFYWYSSPALIKQWQDLVLEHGWAYGRNGRQLAGKYLMNVISTGGGPAAYGPHGHHGHPVNAFMLPFVRTAALCHMQYLSPFIVYGATQLDDEGLDREAARYVSLLQELRSGQFGQAFQTLT